MIALDTNILARYYVLDAADVESGRQHAQAVKALSGKDRFFVPKTVLLELEWVLRGFYDQPRDDILRVFDHLMAMPMVRVEDERVSLRLSTSTGQDWISPMRSTMHQRMAASDS